MAEDLFAKIQHMIHQTKGSQPGSPGGAAPEPGVTPPGGSAEPPPTVPAPRGDAGLGRLAGGRPPAPAAPARPPLPPLPELDDDVPRPRPPAPSAPPRPAAPAGAPRAPAAGLPAFAASSSVPTDPGPPTIVQRFVPQPRGDDQVPLQDYPSPPPGSRPPQGKAGEPAAGGGRLPSNATLDDLIAFAKARTKKADGTSTTPGAPAAAAPTTAPYEPAAAPAGAPPAHQHQTGAVTAAAIRTAMPPDDDMPDLEMDLPAHGVAAARRPAPAPAPVLPSYDDDLATPSEPMLDVDKILADKKARDQQSIKRLFTMDYLPPCPRTPEETGLEQAFLAELIMKTVYFSTELEGLRIAEELALPFGGVIEPIVRALKDENLLEIKGGKSSMSAQWRFCITSKGVEKAHEILQRNGYYGPAPVSIRAYVDMVKRQRCQPEVTITEVKAAFADLVLAEHTLEKVGPAVNSAKSAFLYGPPGNGKTSICERICTLLGGAIFVPHAIEAGGQVIKIYDPYVHNPPQGMENINITDSEMGRMDRRWVICRRPIVIVGGELTLEMLDLTYNVAAKFYEAPFQVKSNGGMLLIDDFGRQKVRPRDLLNRWIVPLEKGVDYLTLHTGKKCELPFDQFIVFSTNLNPADLVDEAFLRRLRYKIEIEDPTVEEFIEIFKRFCKIKGVKYQSSMMKYLLETYYLALSVPFRACHPRDLLDQITDRARYLKIRPQMTPELIDHAWKSYFVKL